MKFNAFSQLILVLMLLIGCYIALSASQPGIDKGADDLRAHYQQIEAIQ